MIRRLTFLNIILLFTFMAVAQAATTEVEIIAQKFRAFDYDAVIELSNKALAHADDFSQDELFQIHEMKAVSYYSKMEMTEALNSFVDILKIDPEHELDPVKYSPKIIAFYNRIKSNFQPLETVSQPVEQKPEKPDTVIVYRQDRSFKKSILPSLVLPGTGHLLIGKKQKGMILTTLSAATLASSIWFTIDCANKEKDYLNAVDPGDIDGKYAEYNSSFKIRNTLWTAYAAIWLYSQIDLLFLQKPDSPIQVGLATPGAGAAMGLAWRVRF